MNDTLITKIEKLVSKKLDDSMALQYKQTFLIQSDNVIYKCYNNKISEKAIMLIKR